MRKFYNTFYSLLKRELNFVKRDKDILVIILLSPLFYAFFLWLHLYKQNGT